MASTTNLPSFDRHSIATADLSGPLLQHQVPDWSTSVDMHFTALRDHFLHCLSTCCPKPRIKAKKPYVSPEIWTLRLQKLNYRKQLKEQRRLLTRESLARVFLAWKSCNRATSLVSAEQDRSLMLSFNYGTSLRCFAIKLVAQFSRATRSLRECLKFAKQQLLNQTLEVIAPETPAGKIQ